MKIYPKNDKRRLYWLIDMYTADQIDEQTFCDEFYYSYALEIDTNTLDNLERLTFKELYAVADRFTPFENDFKIAPGAYTTLKELKDAIIKAKHVLDGHLADKDDNELSKKEIK